jgi:hypothetical protein
MATLEAVVTELKETNQISELKFEATLEVSDNLKTIDQTMNNIGAVLTQFLQTVPASIMKGFDSLLDFEKTQAKQKKREEEIDQQKDSGNEDDKPELTGVKGAFMSGFEKDPVGDFFGDIKKSIFAVISNVGTIAKIITTGFSFIMTGITSLASVFSSLFAAITLPMVLVASAITAIVSGIFGFVEDFKSQEGSLFDKIIAGLGGFVDGFLKILTVPLDWIKSLISTALEFFGFDGASQVLDSFSFTDLIDGLTDSLVEFIIGLKDTIMDGIKGIGKSIMGLFGFGSEEEETEAKDTNKPMNKYERIKAREKRREALMQPGVMAVDKDGNPVDTGKRGRTIGDAPSSEKPVNPETGKRGMEIPRESEQTYSIMTKSGIQDLTEEEIKQGRKDGTIKRSLATDQLRRIKEGVDDSGKRGRVIGEAPAAPTKINPETGKRGMVIPGTTFSASSSPLLDDGEYDATVSVESPEIVAEAMKIDYTDELQQVKEMLSNLFAPVVDAFKSVKEFMSNLIPLDKIQSALTNLFAEIGIPRVEFTIPFIDKTVGFGPFYPFRPGEGTTQIASQTSVETVSSEGDDGSSDYKKIFKDNSSGIEDDSVFSYAKQEANQEVVNELGQKEIISTSTGVSASFDDMTGKGSVVFDEYKSIDNLATDSFEETQSAIKEYEVGPIAMGKVRRMIDAGASPDQVREFLELNERSISEKISSFFSDQVDNASSFVSSFFSDKPMQSDELVPAQERVTLSENMQRETTKMQDGKAAEAKATSVVAPIVNANNNSTSVNNQTINAGPMPSATDKSDRTDRRAAFRGRAI